MMIIYLLNKSLSKSTFRWKETSNSKLTPFFLSFPPAFHSKQKKLCLMTLKLFFDGWHCPSRLLHYDDVIEVKYPKQLWNFFCCCSIALLYMLQRATWWREKRVASCGPKEWNSLVLNDDPLHFLHMPIQDPLSMQYPYTSLVAL